MNVLSLFDGISCGRVALERLGIDVKTYYASEIEKNAIKVSQKNYPEIIKLGSIVGLTPPNNIDLLIGGSPCTDLSIAKKERKGLDGEHSRLFWEYIRIKKECNPKWFILENVNSMSKEAKEIITKEMGVEPIMINASLVSAQSRKRLFWTNIPVVGLPEDKGILLKDILQPDAEIDERMTSNGKAFCIDASYSKGSSLEHSIKKKVRTMVRIGREIGRHLNAEGKREDKANIPITRRIEIRNDDKCGTLTSVTKDNLVVSDTVRKLTPIECERLQGLPDNYTECIANTNRYKCLGNAFNVDVICYILSFI